MKDVDIPEWDEPINGVQGYKTDKDGKTHFVVFADTSSGEWMASSVFVDVEEQR